jgi:hypothetical protein
MQLAVVTSVRNECDIVESFVRHNAAFCDRLYVIDHRSSDATPDILRRLVDEGLPLEVSRDETAVFYQGPRMTDLLKRAMRDRDWDFVLPLDGDELIDAADRAALEAALSDLNGSTVGLSEIVTFIPTAHDDASERDVPRRVVHRATLIPDISCTGFKVSVPGALIRRPGFLMDEGQHGACIGWTPIASRRLKGVSLAHFPIRSAEQFMMRAILFRIAWQSRADYHPSWGWHMRPFIETIKANRRVSAADLTEAALSYVDMHHRTGKTPHRKVLRREPMAPAYDGLQFPELMDVAALPMVLDMLDGLLEELREARQGTAGRSRVRDLLQSAWRACNAYLTRSNAGT